MWLMWSLQLHCPREAPPCWPKPFSSTSSSCASRFPCDTNPSSPSLPRAPGSVLDGACVRLYDDSPLLHRPFDQLSRELKAQQVCSTALAASELRLLLAPVPLLWLAAGLTALAVRLSSSKIRASANVAPALRFARLHRSKKVQRAIAPAC